MRRILSIINSKFRYKLMASYLLIALIPFIMFAAVSVSVSMRHSREMALNHMTQLVGQVSGSIDIYISALEETANYVAAAADGAVGRAAIQTMLRGVTGTHKEIFGALVVFSDDSVVTNNMQRASRDPLVDTDWYRLAIQNPDKLLLLSDLTGRNILSGSDDDARAGNTGTEEVFSVVKAITDKENGRPVGAVLLDVRHALIKNSIDRVSIGRQGFVFVTDESLRVVYTPVNDVVYRVDTGGLTNDRTTAAVVIRNQSYLIGSQKSAYTGWTTVGVFPIEEVMGGVNQLYLILLCFIASTLIVVALISFQIADSVTKPIRYLRALMKEAETGHLTVRYVSKNSDEINDLGLSFNQLLEQVRLLIAQVTKEQRLKRDAEIKSLQEQIKPHFLYNTLDTVVWIARSHKADDIVQIVTAMTTMFRIGLSKGGDVITVGEEMTHVTNYMYIQGVRYKDRLNYTVEIDNRILSCQVPKLILQPLCENAIYHGIKRKRNAGLIAITGGLSETGDIWLSVRDDGAGIAPEKLTRLNASLRSIAAGEDEKETFGIFFIQRRLILAYGAGYGLTFESEEDAGTTATVTMPFRMKDGEQHDL